MSTSVGASLQPIPLSAKIHGRQAALQRLLDLELSVGSESRHHRDGQSLLHDDRGAPRRVAH